MNKKEKLTYIEPVIKFTRFAFEDVITSSGCTDDTGCPTDGCFAYSSNCIYDASECMYDNFSQYGGNNEL